VVIWKQQNIERENIERLQMEKVEALTISLPLCPLTSIGAISPSNTLAAAAAW
jgi:hypothetical protein